MLFVYAVDGAIGAAWIEQALLLVDTLHRAAQRASLGHPLQDAAVLRQWRHCKPSGTRSKGVIESNSAIDKRLQQAMARPVIAVKLAGHGSATSPNRGTDWLNTITMGCTDSQQVAEEQQTFKYMLRGA
jgi:hypothetical protein